MSNDEPKAARVYGYELFRRGGKWLAAARTWLQWHRRNGDRVTWGSNDVLEPAFTVREIEELASEVAAAAFNEQGDKDQQIDYLRKARFDGSCEAAMWKARAEAAQDKYENAQKEIEILRERKDIWIRSAGVQSNEIDKLATLKDRIQRKSVDKFLTTLTWFKETDKDIIFYVNGNIQNFAAQLRVAIGMEDPDTTETDHGRIFNEPQDLGKLAEAISKLPKVDSVDHLLGKEHLPVCSQCNDTHMMTLGSRAVPCTHCPRPCDMCRSYGRGGFCQWTPCVCECHNKKQL